MTEPRKQRTPSVLTQFGKFCHKLRIDKDLSTIEWANLLETSTQTVSLYEHGRKELNAGFLLKVAQVLATVAPEHIKEFNQEFALPFSVIFTGSLTEEQVSLINGVLDGTVRMAVTE